MKPVLPLVLLVEDNELLAGSLIGFFGGGLTCEVLHAAVQDEVEPLLDRHPEVVVAIVDGNVPLTTSGEPNPTFSLIKRIKDRIQGPIIFYSAAQLEESVAMSYGCTHVLRKGSATSDERLLAVVQEAMKGK